MSGHTPGPWAAPKIWAYRYICPADHANRPVGASVDPEIDRDRYMQIVATVDEDKFDRGDLQANARLIAAAPDLLEILKDCQEYFERGATAEYGPAGTPVGNEEMDMLNNVTAAIAKAEPPKADDHG